MIFKLITVMIILFQFICSVGVDVSRVRVDSPRLCWFHIVLGDRDLITMELLLQRIISRPAAP